MDEERERERESNRDFFPSASLLLFKDEIFKASLIDPGVRTMDGISWYSFNGVTLTQVSETFHSLCLFSVPLPPVLTGDDHKN